MSGNTFYRGGTHTFGTGIPVSAVSLQSPNYAPYIHATYIPSQSHETVPLILILQHAEVFQ
jgi:hypothetical protein